MAWNPWLAGDCDTALYANLDSSDHRAVCIGVSSAISTTTTTTTTASATTTTSAGPTQTGVVSGCQEGFTVESGDDCSSIEAEFGVTLAELYAWNPSSTSPRTSQLPLAPRMLNARLIFKNEQLEAHVRTSGWDTHTVSRVPRQQQRP